MTLKQIIINEMNNMKKTAKDGEIDSPKGKIFKKFKEKISIIEDFIDAVFEEYAEQDKIKKELKEYGKKIPLGTTYDDDFKMLTFKDSNDYGEEKTYDKNGNELMHKNSNGYGTECTYDKYGKQLTFGDSFGYGGERTYDKDKKGLTYKNSDGTFIDYTKDK